MQLVHDRGFADPGIAGDEHELGGAVGDDTVEGPQQAADLALPPIEPLRDQHSIRRIPGSQRERLDLAGRFPFRQTALQIARETGRGLVAVLGGLGQELQDDRRERFRDAGDTLARRHRCPGDVAVNPLHRIGGGERRLARQHFVEGDAQRIEIAPGVDRAVHPARLLRRHIGERAGDDLRRGRYQMLARQARSDAEPGQPYAAAFPVHQDIRRLDVLVDQTAGMHPADGDGERNRDAQESRHIQGTAAEKPVERLAAGILQHQGHTSVARCERYGTRRPSRIELVPQRVFILEALEESRRGIFPGGSGEDDRGQALAPAAGQRQGAFAQGREGIGGEFRRQGVPWRSRRHILAFRAHRIFPDGSRGSVAEFTN